MTKSWLSHQISAKVSKWLKKNDGSQKPQNLTKPIINLPWNQVDIEDNLSDWPVQPLKHSLIHTPEKNKTILCVSDEEINLTNSVSMLAINGIPLNDIAVAESPPEALDKMNAYYSSFPDFSNISQNVNAKSVSSSQSMKRECPMGVYGSNNEKPETQTNELRNDINNSPLTFFETPPSSQLTLTETDELVNNTNSETLCYNKDVFDDCVFGIESDLKGENQNKCALTNEGVVPAETNIQNGEMKDSKRETAVSVGCKTQQNKNDMSQISEILKELQVGTAQEQNEEKEGDQSCASQSKSPSTPADGESFNFPVPTARPRSSQRSKRRLHKVHDVKIRRSSTTVREHYFGEAAHSVPARPGIRYHPVIDFPLNLFWDIRNWTRDRANFSLNLNSYIARVLRRISRSKKKFRLMVFSRYLILFVFMLTPGHASIDCAMPLGMESGQIPDSALDASSYYVPSVSPLSARLNSEHEGGGWCPSTMVKANSREYVEVDLGGQRLVTGLATQGRNGQGRGIEYTESYKLEYLRPALPDWRAYQRWDGKDIFGANDDTVTVVTNNLRPPVHATKIRVYPHSMHHRVSCLRLELYGCMDNSGLVSYSAPNGSDAMGDHVDSEFDGLGRLTDGQLGEDFFLVDMGYARGSGWVGWNKSSFLSDYMEINFSFDAIRKINQIDLYANNYYTRHVQIFKSAIAFFSIGGKFFNGDPVVYSKPPDTKNDKARNITLRMSGGRIAKFVRVRLYFQVEWILLSEIYFSTELIETNLTDETEQKNINNILRLAFLKNEEYEAQETSEGLKIILLSLIILVALSFAVTVWIVKYKPGLIFSRDESDLEEHSLQNMNPSIVDPPSNLPSERNTTAIDELESGPSCSYQSRPPVNMRGELGERKQSYVTFVGHRSVVAMAQDIPTHRRSSYRNECETTESFIVNSRRRREIGETVHMRDIEPIHGRFLAAGQRNTLMHGQYNPAHVRREIDWRSRPEWHPLAITDESSQSSMDDIAHADIMQRSNFQYNNQMHMVLNPIPYGYNYREEYDDDSD